MSDDKQKILKKLNDEFLYRLEDMGLNIDHLLDVYSLINDPKKNVFISKIPKELDWFSGLHYGTNKRVAMASLILGRRLRDVFHGYEEVDEEGREVAKKREFAVERQFLREEFLGTFLWCVSASLDSLAAQIAILHGLKIKDSEGKTKQPIQIHFSELLSEINSYPDTAKEIQEILKGHNLLPLKKTKPLLTGSDWFNDFLAQRNYYMHKSFARMVFDVGVGWFLPKDPLLNPSVAIGEIDAAKKTGDKGKILKVRKKYFMGDDILTFCEKTTSGARSLAGGIFKSFVDTVEGRLKNSSTQPSPKQ